MSRSGYAIYHRGGKDGVPYPANRDAMNQSIQILKETVQATKIGDKEKL
jgi:hypothetical protein